MFPLNVVLVVIWLALRALVTRAARPETMCKTCTWAHIEQGMRRQAVYCGFGGKLRRMRRVVCECTDFRDRRDVHRSVLVGFIRERELAAGEVARQ